MLTKDSRKLIIFPHVFIVVILLLLAKITTTNFRANITFLIYLLYVCKFQDSFPFSSFILRHEVR